MEGRVQAEQVEQRAELLGLGGWLVAGHQRAAGLSSSSRIAKAAAPICWPRPPTNLSPRPAKRRG